MRRGSRGPQADHELQIDAGKLDAEAGWRDVKVATFAIRRPAEPRTSADFDERRWPAPSVRHEIASIEPVGAFGPRCRAEAGGSACRSRPG